MKQRSRRKQRRNLEKSKEHLKEKSLAVKRGGTPQLLVDCNPICHASFHALGPLSYNGKPTGVIYGFIKATFDLIVKFNTTDIIFLWDARKQYRSDFYSGYKRKRRELRDQLEAEDIEEYRMLFDQMVSLHHEVLPNIGFNNTFVFHGFEADDLIAHILKSKNYSSKRKIIVTNDADLYQLLDLAHIYLPAKEEIFTKLDFKRKFGVPVSKWVKAKSIGGCNSDDIDGIVGVADPKSTSSKALSYLKGTLPKGKIYDRITSREGRQIILRNKLLTKLPYNLQKIPPFEIGKDNVTIKSIVKVFTNFGFQSLCKKEYLDPIRKLYGDKND